MSIKRSWLTGEPLYAARGRWMCGWVRRSHGWLDAGPIRLGEIDRLRKDFAFRQEAQAERAKYDYERVLRRYARIMRYGEPLGVNDTSR